MHSHGLRPGTEKGSRGGGEIGCAVKAGVQFARQERIMRKAHGVEKGSSSADGWISGQCQPCEWAVLIAGSVGSASHVNGQC